MDLANARISQLMIPVKSIERGTAFYKDVLGLPFLFSAPPQMSFFDCGGVRLLVGVPTPGQPVHRGSTIYFGVSNIRAVHAALKAKGVPVAYIEFEGEQHGVRDARNIVRALEAEAWFYARVLGFELADRVEPVAIDNLWRGPRLGSARRGVA